VSTSISNYGQTPEAISPSDKPSLEVIMALQNATLRHPCMEPQKVNTCVYNARLILPYYFTPQQEEKKKKKISHIIFCTIEILDL